MLWKGNVETSLNARVLFMLGCEALSGSLVVHSYSLARF
jgi:hypothetical protein